MKTAQQRTAEPAAGDEHQQYLTFLCQGETYAMSILRIKEIIEYGTLTSVPMMPAFVRGVINLRGRVVPVVDLAVRFGHQAALPNRRTCIVIVEVGSGDEQQDIGVVVDAVNKVIEIPAQDIEPPPSFGTQMRTDFLQGLGKVDGDFVILLNSERVLAVDEMAQLTQEVQLHEDAPNLAAALS
ncbi:MAG: chemotaxis protein CheW [Candidatus Tectimicrobiota bacterium]